METVYRKWKNHNIEAKRLRRRGKIERKIKKGGRERQEMNKKERGMVIDIVYSYVNVCMFVFSKEAYPQLFEQETLDSSLSCVEVLKRNLSTVIII